MNQSLYYIKINQIIDEYISNLCVGDKLDNERELSLKLSVSRTTLRERLTYLSNRGFLFKHHGKPTRYIKDIFSEEDHF